MTTPLQSPVTSETTVAEFQTYVATYMKERGWDKSSILLQTVMMTEEVGEVCKAIRNLHTLDDTQERRDQLADELADVFAYTCWLATYYGIDLATAFRNKQNRQLNRTWNYRKIA